MNPLESRAERILDELSPQPPTMLTVVLLQITPVAEDAVIRPGFHRLGRHAVCCFMGGSEKERRRELKRLRASGEYDVYPFGGTPPAIGDGETKAIDTEQALR